MNARACLDSTGTSHVTRNASGYTWNAGDVFDGFMEGNIRHGACTYTFFNGQRLECQWIHGRCSEFNQAQHAVLAKFSVCATILQRIGVGGQGGVAAAEQRFRTAGVLDV